VAHAVFWLSALPDFLDAKDGLTSDGTPIGSGWYVIACFVASTAVLVALFRTRRRVPVAA
jgi:threonine/homoserine/homoserine lactone efflux protein